MSANDWTGERIDLLRVYHRKGWSYAEIAFEINRATGSNFSRNACIGKALRIGLAVKRTRPRKEQIERSPRKRARRPTARFERRLNGSIPPDFELLEEIDVAPSPAEFLGVALLDLQPQHCRYPRGGNDGTPVLFCGQPKREDSSYCADCHARCHTGSTRYISAAEHARRSAAAKQIWNRRRVA